MKIEKLWLVFCVVLVLICILFVGLSVSRKTAPFVENEYYKIVYVVDGDTFKVKVKDKIVTIRMLGINTPETLDPRKAEECFGKQASDESKKILAGSMVRFEWSPNREVTDKYGRYLTYVYTKNGIFLNEYLISNGYAKEYTYGKAYSKQSEFKSLEKKAKKDKLGLWGMCNNK